MAAAAAAARAADDIGHVVEMAKESESCATSLLQLPPPLRC